MNLLLAIAIAILGAAAYATALQRRRGIRRVALAIVAVPILLAPLLVSDDDRLGRVLAAIFALFMLFKVWDAHMGANLGKRMEAPTYLRWLLNLCSLVYRKHHLEPRFPTAYTIRRLLGAGAIVTTTLLGLVLAQRVDWQAFPFLVEHAVKATLLFVAFIAGFSIVVQLSRLAGVQARSFTDDLWRAATPAEFWNRYNRIINQFLFENVYRPIRRTRSPALAILLTFTISGIAHEYIFGISASRVYGYQTLFFILQGVAVALTARFRPRGWNAVGAMIATLVFMVCTSVLFFVSFHTVIPLYAHALPAWLWGS